MNMQTFIKLTAAIHELPR